MPDATYNLTQEVRIASVMFGGVSLAIYMNGITQELLRAVRATAPAPPAGLQRGAAAPWTLGPENWNTRRELHALLADGDLDSTEKIYRILGRTLHHGRTAGTPETDAGPIRTRIVVDMLAGTSAGGINSVFLAKALANNQSLQELNHMWMDDADLGTLLNDGKSEPSTYPPGPTTTSLMNSTRMFGLLYKAFSDMDSVAPGAPLAEELDLYVTTTDLDGVALPIQLADCVVDERVHKASFHFTYGPGRFGAPDDFAAGYNPMLAFASRCTSSFPIAFEPMRLDHVDRIIPGFSLDVRRPGHILRKFFRQFERNDPGLDFTRRPLADGGYLNNKPFSFLVDKIRFRTGAVPVCRKLLFLDPFPELNKEVRHTAQDVDFIQNSLDAATTLPRYQTVREDIERLNQYNRDLYAAQSLARDIERESPDIAGHYADGFNSSASDQARYPSRTLRDLETNFGRCYSTYHHLRISAVTEELASLATWLLDQNDNSDAVVAIRMLLHSWRVENFAANGEDGRRLEARFLSDYDVGWRFRRAEYVRSRIDALLAALTGEGPGSRDKVEGLLAAALPPGDVTAAAAALLAAPAAVIPELYRLRDSAEYIKWKIAYENERLREDADDPQRAAIVKALFDTGLDLPDLKNILRPVSEEQCQDRANKLYGSQPVRDNITQAAELLAARYKQLFAELSAGFIDALRPPPSGKSKASEIVRQFVWIHYQYFDCRDMLVFTVLQNQLAGEGSPVEIYRVSPFDAKLANPVSDPSGRNKLAGTALFAFGAFLDGHWRRNDVMWGRLDGAERIISALLPDEEDDQLRTQLCERAFQIIIHEEFNTADLMHPLIAYLRKRISPSGLSADEFLAAAERDAAAVGPVLVQQLLRAISSDADRLDAFRAFYVKPGPPAPETSLQYLRRASRIFGNMLQDTQSNPSPPGAIRTVTAIAVAVTRFVEFCIPQTLPSMVFRYALQLLYAIGLVLLLTGALVYHEVETDGWIVLGVTAAANIAAWIVARRLFGQKTGKRIVGAVTLIVLLLVVFAVLLAKGTVPAAAWKSPLYALAHGLER